MNKNWFINLINKGISFFYKPTKTTTTTRTTRTFTDLEDEEYKSKIDRLRGRIKSPYQVKEFQDNMRDLFLK